MEEHLHDPFFFYEPSTFLIFLIDSNVARITIAFAGGVSKVCLPRSASYLATLMTLPIVAHP